MEPSDRMEFYEAVKYNHMKARSRFTCDNCGEYILEDDRYFDYCGTILCEECVNECMRYA